VVPCAAREASARAPAQAAVRDGVMRDNDEQADQSEDGAVFGYYRVVFIPD
jgi:hypothetical protein